MKNDIPPLSSPAETTTEQTRLQQWMERKGWTKSEFARQMDIAPQNVSKYLAGSLKVEGLYGKLMDLGCDVYWLRTGQGAERSVTTPAMMQMITTLQQAGITTPEQLARLLDVNVEEIANTVASTVANETRAAVRAALYKQQGTSSKEQV